MKNKKITVQVAELYNEMTGKWSQDYVFRKDKNVYIGTLFIKHVPADGIKIETILAEKVFPSNTKTIDIIREAYDMIYTKESTNKIAFKEMLIHQYASGFSSINFKEHLRFKTDAELFQWLEENQAA